MLEFWTLSKDIYFPEVPKELNKKEERKESFRKVSSLFGSLECSRKNMDEENETRHPFLVLCFTVCDIWQVT